MSYDLLEGVKVVELSMYAFAPVSAVVLGDWGAEVVKVVAPDIPDVLMGNSIGGLPNNPAGTGFMWHIMNRGKRAIGIDVATEEGRDLLLELVASADVFITNMLPARARFRLDPEDLFAINPGLIYARATGHGDRGPEARIRRLRPHRLLGSLRDRPRRQHGDRRVRPPGRPGDG